MTEEEKENLTSDDRCTEINNSIELCKSCTIISYFGVDQSSLSFT
jgi:hypothetical protein